MRKCKLIGNAFIFGQNIKIARKRRNIDVCELAKQANYDRNDLSQLEYGEHNISYKAAVNLARIEEQWNLKLNIHKAVMVCYNINRCKRALKISVLKTLEIKGFIGGNIENEIRNRRFAECRKEYTV